jgi:hypothetical protein
MSSLAIWLTEEEHLSIAVNFEYVRLSVGRCFS